MELQSKHIISKLGKKFKKNVAEVLNFLKSNTVGARKVLTLLLKN